ncbi:MAG: protein kinase [Acidobacteria bacterium]|nr:protein kinase [Acidobacteriota bacterium]
MHNTVSHYRIVEKLGEGGMGEVYLAEDMLLERRVAIKFPQLSNDRDERARFLREARLASSLNHPNIATIHDFGETGDGQPFLVMELVEGESLGRVLAGGMLPVERSVRIALEVASALEEAHRRGIVHRDIKPSNIALSARGAVKVLDFGLAKRIRPPGAGNPADSPTRPRANADPAATRPGVAVGTPLYMSPEQVRGEEIDARSDLFSLGVLLHECLSGAPPFEGDNFTEISAKILQSDPPPPSQRNPRVPPLLDQITARALAKQAADRYASAEELRADLETALTALDNADNADDADDADRRARSTSEEPRVHGSKFRSALHSLAAARPAVKALIAVLAVAAAAAIYAVTTQKRPNTTGAASPEAMRAYTEGVAALRDGAWLKAGRALGFAVEADPKFALAHMRLAEAWVELDNIDRAGYEIAAARALIPQPAVLPRADELYLQAINETVVGDYPAAIGRYREIAELEPGNPHVYFELARAYERNQQRDDAMSQYEQALARDRGYAAAHLRLGILYGRNRDQARGAGHFDEAERIYRALSNIEGANEVVFQRGLMLTNLSNPAAARAQFDAALAAARGAPDNEYQQIRALLQLSTIASLENDPAEAERYASEALEMARERGIEYLTTSGVIRLGAVCLQNNRITEAERYTRAGLEQARRYKTPRYEATASVNLGSILIAQRMTDEGLALVEKWREFYEINYPSQAAQVRRLIGRARRDRGEYDAALAAFESELSGAVQAGDDGEIAEIHHEMGQVLLRVERYPEALDHFERGIVINRRLGEKEDEFYGLINAALASGRLGMDRSGDASMAQAARLARTDELRASLFYPQAELLLLRGRFREALAAGQRAIERADRRDEDLIRRAELAVARAQLGLGRTTEAAKLAESVRAAMADWKQRSMPAAASMVIAAAQLAAGEAAAARESVRESITEFERAGQRNSLWRAVLVSARASAALNDWETARSEAARAARVLEEWTSTWSGEHARGYRGRADVAEALRHLDALREEKPRNTRK